MTDPFAEPPAQSAPPVYGQQPYGQPAAPPYAQPTPYGQGYGQGYGAGPSNGLGTAALVLGILAILGCWVPFLGIGAAVLGVLALVFGIVGRRRVGRGEATNGGAALTGVILGALSIVIAIAVTTLLATHLHKCQTTGGGVRYATNCSTTFGTVGG